MSSKPALTLVSIDAFAKIQPHEMGRVTGISIAKKDHVDNS